MDIAAGPHHSVFISPEKIYLCGRNSNYCLGLGDDEGPHALREIDLGVTLTEKSTVCTNGHCTVIREGIEVWIAGTVPNATFQTFTLVSERTAMFSPLSGNALCRSNCNKLLKVRHGDDDFVVPVHKVTPDCPTQHYEDVEVTLANYKGVLKYQFSSGRCTWQPVLLCVSGILVSMRCEDFHVSEDGNVILLACLSPVVLDHGALYSGRFVLVRRNPVHRKSNDFPNPEPCDYDSLGVILMLEEIPGAVVVTSFARSPDGQNLIFVTNSSTRFLLRAWKSAEYEQLSKKLSTIQENKVKLDVCIVNKDHDKTYSIGTLLRSRYPKIDSQLRLHGAVWISDIAQEAGIESCLCLNILSQYLLRHEDIVMKGSPYDKILKSVLEGLNGAIGIHLREHNKFYQLGDVITCLDDVAVKKDCVLMSEDGAEFWFNRQWLELQSPYFGVAANYQTIEDVPRFRLYASADQIRRTLLAIANPSYFRHLLLEEILDLLSFLDYYLLHPLLHDALYVLFEKINEFNVTSVFEHYKLFPQLRSFLMEHFRQHSHLAAWWKTSAAAPLELLRDIWYKDKEMECVKAGITQFGDLSCTDRVNRFTSIFAGPFRAPHSKPDTYDHWSDYHEEDVLQLLLGPKHRDSVELKEAVLEYLHSDMFSPMVDSRMFDSRMYEPAEIHAERMDLFEEADREPALIRVIHVDLAKI
ncbi:hypothetical protein ANCCAN_07114 [Ancylostoma caninum]|uniref:Uncharacterized protein n=1 Tax=Ancylostoma caninum TaxID=29170 RepID=A0A368GUU8_ANCCA|nr:hypothetical protein ANCCAN_07114 [Ancylostoma caninum]